MGQGDLTEVVKLGPLLINVTVGVTVGFRIRGAAVIIVVTAVTLAGRLRDYVR